MNKFFKEVKKNFGFGCMRLPILSDNSIDYETFKEMIDLFMASGFNYFDTARIYHNGESEIALRECLVKRYNRDDFVLTNKLTSNCFNSKEDLEELFLSQLNACGVSYFDFYLVHAVSESNIDKYESNDCFAFVKSLKERGLIKHIGISFHGTTALLDRVLNDYPFIEAVQLQFNYLDYNNSRVQSKKCYDIATKYNKPVIVMEPVRGGRLVNIETEAEGLIDLKEKSAASYAIRFAASFDSIMMVLSGMSDMSQMEDNVSYMKDFIPLDDETKEKLFKIADIINEKNTIPCTACEYCVNGCPKKINIPGIIKCINDIKVNADWGGYQRFKDLIAEGSGKPSSCIKCGKCEKICPQEIKIRNILENATEMFEK